MYVHCIVIKVAIELCDVPHKLCTLHIISAASVLLNSTTTNYNVKLIDVLSITNYFNL